MKVIATTTIEIANGETGNNVRELVGDTITSLVSAHAIHQTARIIRAVKVKAPLCPSVRPARLITTAYASRLIS